jgi:hypothetical protein
MQHGGGPIPTAAARAALPPLHTRRWLMVCEDRMEKQPGARFYSPKGSAAGPENKQDLNNPAPRRHSVRWGRGPGVDAPCISGPLGIS